MSTNPNYLKGVEAYKTKDYQLAVELFTKAIETEENPYIYYERGLSLFHLRKTNDALQDFDKAVELQPEKSFRYSSRAYVKDKLGDVEGAIADYKKAIELDPEDAVAYNNLGLLEEKLGWKEKAKLNFDKADSLASIQNLTTEPIRDGDSTKPSARESLANQSLWSVISNVLTSAHSRKEFFTFVKNGFKLNA